MKRILPFLLFLLLPLAGLGQVQINVTDTYFNSSTGRVAGRTAAGPGTTAELTADQAVGVVGTGTGGYSFRNRLKNADMRIDQANAAASLSISTAANADSVDMWFGFGTASAGVFTLQQSTSTPPAGYTNFLRFATTTADASPAAGANYYFATTIEGQEIQDFQLGAAGAKTVTLSFQARSSLTGTFSGALQNSAANRSYPFSYSIGSANTWTAETVTITLDTTGTWLTTTGVGLRVLFDMGSGATARGTAGSWSGSTFVGVTSAVRVISTNAATFDLTGVQLELGSIATTFEVRDFATEFLRVCRYYWTTFPIGTKPAQNAGNTGSVVYLMSVASSNRNGVQVRYPASMRAAPTPTYYNPGATNSSWRNITHGADSGASSSILTSERADFITNAQAVADLVADAGAIQASYDARLH